MIQWWQILLLTLYSAYQICDELTIVSSAGSPVFAGFITGLVMGDLKTGLYIGATLQLMTLGISSFGGASVPDYQTAALVGSYIAISTKQDASIGITLAIPVAMLMVQLDVLKWSINIFFQNKAEKFAEAENYKGIERMHYCGVLCTMCTSGIPVLLTVIFGPKLVGGIINYIPDWLSSGLSIAGGLLPAVGIGLLLRYLPVKSYFGYLIAGFVAAVYLNVPILGVALIGFAIALIIYKNKSVEAVSPVVAGGMDEDE